MAHCPRCNAPDDDGPYCCGYVDHPRDHDGEHLPTEESFNRWLEESAQWGNHPGHKAEVERIGREMTMPKIPYHDPGPYYREWQRGLDAAYPKQQRTAEPGPVATEIAVTDAMVDRALIAAQRCGLIPSPWFRPDDRENMRAVLAATLSARHAVDP